MPTTIRAIMRLYVRYKLTPSDKNHWFVFMIYLFT